MDTLKYRWVDTAATPKSGFAQTERAQGAMGIAQRAAAVFVDKPAPKLPKAIQDRLDAVLSKHANHSFTEDRGWAPVFRNNLIWSWDVPDSLFFDSHEAAKNAPVNEAGVFGLFASGHEPSGYDGLERPSFVLAPKEMATKVVRLTVGADGYLLAPKYITISHALARVQNTDDRAPWLSISEKNRDRWLSRPIAWEVASYTLGKFGASMMLTLTRPSTIHKWVHHTLLLSVTADDSSLSNTPSFSIQGGQVVSTRSSKNGEFGSSTSFVEGHSHTWSTVWMKLIGATPTKEIPVRSKTPTEMNFMEKMSALVGWVLNTNITLNVWSYEPTTLWDRVKSRTQAALASLRASA